MAEKVQKRTIDFSHVKDQTGINPKRMPAGDYLAKIIGVVDKAASDETPMWNFLLQLDENRTAVYPYYCKLQENQLWKLRNLIIATGMAAPKKRMSVDPERLVGKEVAITLGDDEYEGKPKSVVEAIFPASDLQDEVVSGDDEDDEDVVPDGDDVEEPEDVEEDTEETEDEEPEEDDEETEGDEFDAMDRDALKRALKKAGLGGVKRSESDDDLRARLRATDDEDEEEEADDEIDLDEI